MTQESNATRKGSPAALSARQVEALARGGSEASEAARLLEVHSPSLEPAAASRGARQDTHTKAAPTTSGPGDFQLAQEPPAVRDGPRSTEMRGSRPELEPPSA
jgi:hypothetical protein